MVARLKDSFMTLVIFWRFQCNGIFEIIKLIGGVYIMSTFEDVNLRNVVLKHLKK